MHTYRASQTPSGAHLAEFILDDCELQTVIRGQDAVEQRSLARPEKTRQDCHRDALFWPWAPNRQLPSGFGRERASLMPRCQARKCRTERCAGPSHE